MTSLAIEPRLCPRDGSPMRQRYKPSGARDGWVCSSCTSRRSRRWAVANAERVLALGLRYREENRERINEDSRRRYATPERRSAVRATQQRRIERNRTIVADELRARGSVCVRCLDPITGEYHWHHRDPETKVEKIATLIQAHSHTRLRAELAKCDPLHPDCHIEEHRGS